MVWRTAAISSSPIPPDHGHLTGLLQEFLSTGDRARTTQALCALVDFISQSGHASAQTEGRP
jgi:hypothetical protein